MIFFCQIPAPVKANWLASGSIICEFNQKANAQIFANFLGVKFFGQRVLVLNHELINNLYTQGNPSEKYLAQHILTLKNLSADKNRFFKPAEVPKPNLVQDSNTLNLD